MLRHCIAFVIGVLVLSAHSAFADSDAGACNAPIVYPLEGDVPANLPGFLIVSETEAVLTRTDTGEEIALTISTSSYPNSVFAVPTVPLVEGVTYTLEVPLCTGLSEETVTFTYNVGAAIVLPASLGTLEVGPHSRTWPNENYHVTSFPVTLTPTAEMAPWISLYGIRWFVDQSGTTSQLGRDFAGDEAGALVASPHVDCPGAYDSGSPYVFPEGPLTVRVVATPFFDGAELTASVDTTAVCTGVTEEPRPEPSEEDDPPASGGLCSASSGGGAPATALVLALAALVLATRRRRAHGAS